MRKDGQKNKVEKEEGKGRKPFGKIQFEWQAFAVECTPKQGFGEWMAIALCAKRLVAVGKTEKRKKIYGGKKLKKN